MKPPLRIILTHIQNFHQSGNNKLTIKGKRFSLVHPGFSLLLLKYPSKLFRFAQLSNILLQHRNFQVLTIKTQMSIKHLGKNSQHSCLVLINRPFNINVKKNRLCLTLCHSINHHKSTRVILKFPSKHLNGRNITNASVCQDIR